MSRMAVVLSAILVMSLGAAPLANSATSCRITANDKLATRDTSAMLDVVTPDILAISSGSPSRQDIQRAVRAASRFASTARVSQVRADNPTLKRIFGLYAAGWTRMTVGLQASLNGDDDLASSSVSRGRATYRRGQAVFRQFIRDCRLGAGSLR